MALHGDEGPDFRTRQAEGKPRDPREARDFARFPAGQSVSQDVSGLGQSFTEDLSSLLQLITGGGMPAAPVPTRGVGGTVTAADVNRVNPSFFPPTGADNPAEMNLTGADVRQVPVTTQDVMNAPITSGSSPSSSPQLQVPLSPGEIGLPQAGGPQLQVPQPPVGGVPATNQTALISAILQLLSGRQ